MLMLPGSLLTDMTSLYDRLQEEPQTKADSSKLNLGERQELRKIQIRRTSDQTNPGHAFTTVYYLAGQERAAAEKFVTENRDALKKTDFSHRNPIQQAVSRNVYDWILHFIGERELRKYAAVVYERRRDGTQWVIDRNVFEDHPMRRYTISETNAARVVDIDVDVLYDELADEITESDLRDHEAVAGAVEYLLEYYRVAGLFDCEPVTADGEIAIRKRS